MHLKLPRALGQMSLRIFAKAYKINLDEAEKDISEYASIGDFFIRRLKPQARPLAESPLLHPADSMIAQIGEIAQGQCVQAKDRYYSVSDLVHDPEAAKYFQDGLYVTYYLCPTDYHRVHSPLDGEIVRATYIPGQLWPVNSWSTENIEGLFGVNERVVLHIKSRVAKCILVFVGATNVGQIRLSFDQDIVTNMEAFPQMKDKIYERPVKIEKGQELGLFAMGSTVVMIYPKTVRLQRDDWSTFKNKAVQVRTGFL